VTAPRRGLEAGTGDDEGSSTYTPTPCRDDMSNDGPTCPELPNYYGPCGIPTADSILTYNNVTIGFDYELYYSGTATPIDYIEGIILEHLAAIWGVGCDNARDRNLQESLALVALSSSPRDRLNEAVSCTAPVTSVSGASTCHAMEGSLTLFTGPNSDGNFLRLTSGVIREVRSGMDLDLYVSGNVNKVKFMGQRGIFLPPTPDTVLAPDDSSSDKESRSTAIVASLLSVLLLLLVATVVFVLFLVRKGKNNIKYLEDISTSDEEGMTTDEDENPKQADQEQCVEGKMEQKSTDSSNVQREKFKCEHVSEPEVEYLRGTLALARSLSTEPVDFSYQTYELDGSDDTLSSAASSSQGGLHLVDEDEDDTVVESLRRVTEIDFSDDR